MASETDAVLNPVAFFPPLARRLGAGLPAGATVQRRGRLIKAWFDHPETHFEIWHHVGRGRLEVGLHFEGPPILNDAAFEFFRARMVAVKGLLQRAELEPWDRGWKRLYETLDGTRLTAGLLEQALTLCLDYVSALQPLVEEFWADAPPFTPGAPRRPRSRTRRRRRTPSSRSEPTP